MSWRTGNKQRGKRGTGKGERLAFKSLANVSREVSTTTDFPFPFPRYSLHFPFSPLTVLSYTGFLEDCIVGIDIHGTWRAVEFHFFCYLFTGGSKDNAAFAARRQDVDRQRIRKSPLALKLF